MKLYKRVIVRNEDSNDLADNDFFLQLFFHEIHIPLNTAYFFSFYFQLYAPFNIFLEYSKSKQNKSPEIEEV